MKKYVTMGAILQCNFGMTPASLMVINPMRPMLSKMLQATTMDFIPLTNILPFGMCQSTSNPTVASATAAAMGVLTPMPCVPSIVSPWSPGAKMKICGVTALLEDAKLTCMWGGSITIKSPGNTSAKGE